MKKRAQGVAILILAMGVSHAAAQKMTSDDTAKITHIARDFCVSDISNAAWDTAVDIPIDHYWSGVSAPLGRGAVARLLWSDAALYVRFVAAQTEQLIISSTPDTSKKTLGLWDRDVCEIFVAPDAERPNKYFEFELAPTGEWVDLGIEVLPDQRKRDDDYRSGMQSHANVEPGKVTLVMRIDWKAFGRTPKPGDRWRGNLFRCVGKDPDRGYLAWQPTLTKNPSFHVPEKFGQFLFVK